MVKNGQLRAVNDPGGMPVWLKYAGLVTPDRLPHGTVFLVVNDRDQVYATGVVVVKILALLGIWVLYRNHVAESSQQIYTSRVTKQNPCAGSGGILNERKRKIQ